MLWNIPQTFSAERIFSGDILFVWEYSIDELDRFFDYMNKVDPTKKNQFLWKLLLVY